MSIVLRADNRPLFKDTKFSYLLDNYSAGTSTFKIANTNGFYRNSFVCVGNIGTSNSEIVQLDTVDPITGSITLSYYNGNIVSITDSLNTSPAVVVTTDKPHGLSVGSFVTLSGTPTYDGTWAVINNADLSDNTFGLSLIFSTNETGVWISSNRTSFNHAHSESSRITVLSYNTVRFFYTASPVVPNAVPITTNATYQNSFITTQTTEVLSNTNLSTYTKTTDPTKTETVGITPPIVFSGTTPLTNFIPLQISDFYSTYEDNSHATGYGWFAFFNTTTLQYSPISNPIPYKGFEANTVKATFDAFNSCLNTKELRLITDSDRYSWLNEGYSTLVNELNLGNWEYNATGDTTLTLVSGVSEYLLPDDFSALLYVNDAHGDKIDSFSSTFQRPHTSTGIRYAIRGRYIVFDPIPSSDISVTLSYMKPASVLTMLSDVIDLPNRAHYYVKDFMLYRAYKKLNNSGEAQWYYQTFTKNIESMKILSLKRDEGLDSWSTMTGSNV